MDITCQEDSCDEKQPQSSDSVLAEPSASTSEWVSITQAAKLHNVTRQAIYVAIKQQKLKASKTTRWEINLKDLETYKQSRYSRKNSLYQGELLFDNQKGWYSVKQVAGMLNVPIQKIYYATRIKALSGIRKGAAWVIHISEVEKYKAVYLNKQECVPVEQLKASEASISE